jgi:dihydroorotase
VQVPSDAGREICVLNAEIHFLKHLAELHRDFPRLRIILEHATTKNAVDMVRTVQQTRCMPRRAGSR